MKFTLAAVGLLCLRELSGFTPSLSNDHGRLGVLMDVSRSGPTETTKLMGVSSDEEGSTYLLSNRVASAVAAGIITASALGLSTDLSPAPPVFAATKTETVAKKVPSEVITVETAKSQLTAASQAITEYQSAIASAKKAEALSAKEVAAWESQVANAKKNAAAAKDRLKSLKSNTKADSKAVSTAEAKVGEYISSDI